MTKFRKLLSILLFVGIAILFTFAVNTYWQYRDLHPKTEDAYVQAYTVDISGGVPGKVSTLNIDDNQVVEKGQLLLTIDPKPYQYAVTLAQANLATAKQNVAAQIQEIAVDKAHIAKAQAQLEERQKNAKRILKLVQTGRASPSEGDAATTELAASTADLQAAEKQLQLASDKLGQTNENNSQIVAATAKLQQAELRLARTKIYAPADGIVAKVNLRQGDYVTPGKALFTLIETKKWWVEANFKETDLARIKTQQPATISVDIYPQKKFHGIVASVSPGAGSAFSLLPPENASGNWVKVTQRVPVKILIQDDLAKTPLHIGTSASVTIDTTASNE